MGYETKYRECRAMEQICEKNLFLDDFVINLLRNVDRDPTIRLLVLTFSLYLHIIWMTRLSVQSINISPKKVSINKILK